jgi:hypothetical protein
MPSHSPDIEDTRRSVVAVVAVTAVLVTAAVVSSVAAPKRRVILYGDSLAFEARDYFTLAMESGTDVQVVDRTFGGTAICDRLDQMRRDLPDLQPTAVVLEFVGNNVTDCMRGPNGRLTGAALVQKYGADARIATGIFAGAGVRVYWMGAPAVSGPAESEFEGVRRVYAAEPRRLTFATPPLRRVEYFDAGQAVLDHGRFTSTLPCLPSEGADKGCVGGRIRVRADDGIHFCLVRIPRDVDRCPEYSGGAARFGFAMAEPVRRDLGL